MSDETAMQAVDDGLQMLNKEIPGWLEQWQPTDKGIYMAMAYMSTLMVDENPQGAMAMATFIILARLALERGLIEGNDDGEA